LNKHGVMRKKADHNHIPKALQGLDHLNDLATMLVTASIDDPSFKKNLIQYP
jgi:hypothetical protein